MSRVLLAVCGAAVGLGLWLLFAAATGWSAPFEELRRSWERHGVRSPRRWATAIGVGAAVLVITRWPIAAPATVIGVVVFAGRFGSIASSRAMTARSEAVASWAETLRDTIVAGAGLPQALVTAARLPPPALAKELRRLADHVEGRGVQRALTEFAVDVGHPAADVLVVALVTANRHGAADLVSLISTQVEATRHEVDLVLETEAGRARYRTGVRIMLGALGLFALGLQILQRDFLRPYDTWGGQAVLAVLATVILGALGLLSSMGRQRQAARFFAPSIEPQP